MKFAVVAHHTRQQEAMRLVDHLKAQLFMDEGNHGSTWNHRRALEWASQQEERVIILEDDAIPTRNFETVASLWLMKYPDDLVSFYLGTSRPPQWQLIVGSEVTRADSVGDKFIKLPKLIHGVCYSLPREKIKVVLDRMNMSEVADFSIGNAWMKEHRTPVVYTIHSLVEHNDGQTCETHPDGLKERGIRKARRLNAPLVW